MKKTIIDRFPPSSSAIICGCASSAFAPESEQMNGEKLYQPHLSTVPASWFTLMSTSWLPLPFSDYI